MNKRESDDPTVNTYRKVLSWDVPAPGTYEPDMSKKDTLRWKAKLIKGKDERVEIRKTVRYSDTQLVLIVRAVAAPEHKTKKGWRDPLMAVHMSMNGTARFTKAEWEDMMQAIEEARSALGCASCP